MPWCASIRILSFLLLSHSLKVPGFGDRSRSEMRVILQLPHTVQVGHAQGTHIAHATNELLVSIPLDALRPQSPAEEPEPFSPAEERGDSVERRPHKHKKHKKNKRHQHDSRREADKRLSGGMPASLDDSSPDAAPLKFSYRIPSSPPRLPPPSLLIPPRTPETSSHSKSGKLRHARDGDSGEADSPVATQATPERVMARSGKPTSLAGLASMTESESQRHKKRQHKGHQQQHQEYAAAYSPLSGNKAVTAPQALGKESNMPSKKVKTETFPSAPPLMEETLVGVVRNAVEPRIGSKTPVELPTGALRAPPVELPTGALRAPPVELPPGALRAPPVELPPGALRAPPDPTRTRSLSVTLNPPSFPSRPTTPLGQSHHPFTPTTVIGNTPTPPQGVT